MNKKIIITLVSLCALVVVLIGFNKFSNFQSKARDNETIAVLNSIYTSLQAAHAETSLFPVSLEEAGFNYSSEDMVLDYKSTGTTFVATAVNKVTGKGYSIDQERNLRPIE